MTCSINYSASSVFLPLRRYLASWWLSALLPDGRTTWGTLTGSTEQKLSAPRLRTKLLTHSVRNLRLREKAPWPQQQRKQQQQLLQMRRKQIYRSH